MKPCEEWHLDTSYLGRRVLVFERLPSTNTFALALADDVANDGLVVLADEQTQGHGQHGRTWSCPGGSGVLMSVLLFPPPNLRRPAILTAWAAVAVCELIEKTAGLQATIKWPNDLLVEGRKVCGILIEQARGTVAGIGLNVNQQSEHFAAAGLIQGASLAMFTGKQLNTRDVARQLIAELDAGYDRLCRVGVMELEACWKHRIGLVGSDVEVETHAGSHTGQLLGLGFEAIVLGMEDDTTVSWPPESVRHLRCSERRALPPPS